MKLCTFCNSLIISKSAKKFCSCSCAAKFNNLHRLPRTESSKLKQSQRRLAQIDTIPKFTKIIQCVVCYKWFPAGTRKTCSRECFHTIKSIKQSHRLKTDVDYRRKLGTNNRSFMETSFESWISSNFPTLPCVVQQQFKNEKPIGYYYVDFYFPTLHLAIELDGSQHSKIENIQHDRVRDNFLLSRYNVTVVRVTARDYRLKTRIHEITKLLSVLDQT